MNHPAMEPGPDDDVTVEATQSLIEAAVEGIEPVPPLADPEE